MKASGANTDKQKTNTLLLKICEYYEYFRLKKGLFNEISLTFTARFLYST